MAIVIIAAALGLIPASIANKKGHSFMAWWVFGTLLWIVALPMALIMKPKAAALEQRALNEGMKKCPVCAELVKAEALKCRYCGAELAPPRPA